MTMTRSRPGDETDVLQAAIDWHAAGCPKSGKFWLALEQTAGALVEAIDREESQAAADDLLPVRNSFDAVQAAE